MLFNKAWFRLLWLITLLISVIWVVTQLRVESSLLRLLPKYESQQTNDLIEKATERINKQLVLMASSEQNKDLINKFKKVLQVIEKNDYIKSINYQVDQDQIQSIYQELLPHRHNILSPEDQLAFTQQSGVAYFLFQAQSHLYGVQQFTAEQLQADPLFLWLRLIESMADLNVMSFDAHEGYFLVNQDDRQFMVAFIELEDSAYLPENQAAVVNGIDGMRDVLAAEHVDLAAFGAVLYAHQAFQDAKGEISTVGLGSLIGIVLLIVLVFKSPVPLFFCVTSIGFGLMVALALTALVFAEVHAFALVFGATIAGVSIDYCFHYLVVANFGAVRHVNQTDNDVSTMTMQKILPGLLIGFSSSALVYLGFLITGYEVLAQVALFSVLGLLAVLVNVLVFFPWLYRAQGFQAQNRLQKITAWLLYNPLQRVIKKPMTPLLLLVITVAVTLVFIKPNDDVRALQQLSSTLKQQEIKIREVLAWPSNDAFVLITADGIDELLTKEAAVLNDIRNFYNQRPPNSQPPVDLPINMLVGISDFIPGSKQQQQQHLLQRSLYTDSAVAEYLAQLGLSEPEIGSFNALDVNILSQKAFSSVFRHRWLGEVNEQEALIIPLSPKQVKILNTLSVENNQLTLIQQARDTSDLFAAFRSMSTLMLVIAVLVLWLVLSIFRYGALWSAHLLSLPLLAGVLALLLTAVLGLHVSLFSVLALLLILGMGLDYVIFLKESDQPQEVMLALMMSATTTVLAFGLLGLSQVAVLKSFGFMVGIGITMVLLMAPAVVKSKPMYNHTDDN